MNANTAETVAAESTGSEGHPEREARDYVRIHGLSKHFGSSDSAQVLRDVNLTLREGELLSLLGPSGCGKTTTLRCLAGLERPDSGLIAVRGTSVVDTERKLFVPPESRKIGMAFQSYALWPHMRVSDNVAYPLKVAKRPRAERDERTQDVLERVGLGGKGHRYPRELSGGEQQRVALARAIVGSPDVLLLDEPLSNLDAKLRQETLVWLVGLLRELNVTTVYVTHDQTEALAISDRIAVMNAGQVVQHGTPTQVYERPASTFVAQFVGAANLIPGRAVSRSGDSAEVQPASGGRTYTAHIAEAGQSLSVGDAVQLAVKPEAIRAQEAEPPGGGIRGDVELKVYYGNGWEYVIRVADQPVRMRCDASIVLEPGRGVWLTFEGQALTALLGEESPHEKETNR